MNNEESHDLRQVLADLCLEYNDLVADRDTIDVRVASEEPYGETKAGVDPKSIYETESESLGDDIRSIVIKIVEVGQEIRKIEGF